MIKTYPTKTQAIKAKKFGQTTRQRRDKKWVCEWPHRKCDNMNNIEDTERWPKSKKK